jgi:hypothetical protein
VEALNNIRWRNGAFEEYMANPSNGKSTSDKTAVFFIVGNVFFMAKSEDF